MSRTPAELGGKLAAMAREVADNRDAVGAAALAIKDTTLPLVRAATGGDGKLSGVGRNGAKVGVRYDVRGTVNATALIRATGPAQLVERDVKPHFVFPRKARAEGVRQRTKSYMRLTAGGRQKRVAVDTRSVAMGFGVRVNVGRSRIKFEGKGGDMYLPFAKVRGSKGRKPYERGFERGGKVAPAAYARAQRRGLVEVFR